jgi:translin
MFEEIIERIRQKLDVDDDVRENSLKATRKSVRLCQEAVASIQRDDFEAARKNLDECTQMLRDFDQSLRTECPEIYYKGNIMTMQQEYVEAALLLALMEGKTEIQGPEALNVSVYAYLGGLGDTVGELRRYSLRAIRQERFEQAEKCLKLMEELYDLLHTLDYPEGLLPGLRRKVDVARSLIEKTRTDLTYFQHGKDLVTKMDRLIERLDKFELKKE